MAIDRARIEAAVAELLAAIGEDAQRPGLRETPARVAESYAEFFGGLELDPVEPLRDAVPLGDSEAEAVLVRDVQFRSMCEHHLLPFTGAAHIAYLPGDRVAGIGRFARVVEALAARPQVQERLGEEIADAIVAGLKPRGALVVLDAAHSCLRDRGARQSRARVVTLASRGALAAPVARAEIVALLGGVGA